MNIVVKARRENSATDMQKDLSRKEMKAISRKFKDHKGHVLMSTRENSEWGSMLCGWFG